MKSIEILTHYIIHILLRIVVILALISWLYIPAKAQIKMNWQLSKIDSIATIKDKAEKIIAVKLTYKKGQFFLYGTKKPFYITRDEEWLLIRKNNYYIFPLNNKS